MKNLMAPNPKIYKNSVTHYNQFKNSTTNIQYDTTCSDKNFPQLNVNNPDTIMYII